MILDNAKPRIDDAIKLANEKKELKVGDRIYVVSYNSISSIRVIDRVTNSFAFSGQTKFKKEYTHEITIVPSVKWQSTYCYLETDKLKEKLKLQNAKSFVRMFDFHLLSDEKILKLKTFLENLKK